MKANEQGPSMVEMLGVLAIIGVLSIGGIAGYTMAMNRYKANQLLDLASKISVAARTAQSTTKTDGDWNDTMGSVYRELGVEGYGRYVNASTSSYETTFWVEPEGDVYIWVNQPSIEKAINSITGDSPAILVD